MVRPALAVVPLALTLTFCSLTDLDYLRDSSCAPTCGADAAIDAEARDTQPPENDVAVDAPTPCGADAGYRALVLCDRPAAYFRLDDLGPPDAIDEVDGGPAGAYVTTGDGGVTYGVPGAIAGDDDKAIHLGGDAFVSGGPALGFPQNAPFSLEAWVAPEGDSFSYRRIMERLAYDVNGSPHDGYILYNHDPAGCERWVDGGVATTTTTVIGNGAFSHVVATYDGAALRLYIDGSLRATADAGAPADDVPATFYVGGSLGPYSGWIGAIDEVAVYDHALLPERVTAHYRAGRGL
jgi:hypothetical protein